MKKMKKSKGFTLAELLIVVAIMAVLVGVAIPVFGSQLEKAREATDEANIRTEYAEAVTAYLSDGTNYPGSYDGPTLNYPEKLTWNNNGGDKLEVNYAATKISSLELSANGLS